MFFKYAVMKNIIGQVIAFLFILMFSYAAVSKWLDYDMFLIQLKKSEYLTSFASLTSWIVPAIELLACVLLAVPKWRLAGLYISYGLMFIFTGYIVLILQLADQIPCSCGGILEHMSWTQHLVFNLVFLILSLYAIYIFMGPYRKKAEHL